MSSSPIPRKKDTQARDSLRVLNVNFQSLKKKGKFLEALISSTDPDIIIGTETWLNDQVSSSEFLSNDLQYDVYRRDRLSDSHGGVLIAAKRELTLSNIYKSDAAEFLSGSIKLKNQKPVVIAAYYRPPNRTDDHYLDKTKEEIISLRTKNRNSVIILGGDFNLPDIEWGDMTICGTQYPRKLSEVFLSAIAETNLEQQVDFPTRKDNTLDLILTSHPGYKLRCKPLPAIGNSDHDIVLYDTTLKPRRAKPPRRRIYLWKKANVDAIKEDVRDFNASHQEEITDVDTSWENLKNMLHKSIEENVPSKLTAARHSLPWMNTTTKRSIRRKQRAHKKARSTRKKRDKDRYKRLQQEAQFQLKVAHQEYMKEVVSEDYKGNSKKFWSYVKNKGQENAGVAPLKNNAGYLKSDPQSKTDILNDQFQSVFTKEDMEDFPDMGQSPHQSMGKISVNQNGVHKLLINLQPHKATGPDEIPSFVLKAAADDLAPFLTRLYQTSLDQGIVPQDWKDARVVPIFKKGEKHIAANYRPVSLTSIACKILEHIVHSSIMTHFDEFDILCDNQHGFRK